MDIIKKLMYATTTAIGILTGYLILHPVWAILSYVLFNTSPPMDDQQRMAVGFILGLMFDMINLILWYCISEMED